MRRALVLLALLGGVAHASSASLPALSGMYILGGNAPAGTSNTALVLVDSRVDVSIHGAIAEVVVHQKFHSDAEHVTEATYIFPLPEDAAVTGMAITTGDRTIHAAIAARADAQKRYEDAVTAGVGAALLDEERPDVFTQTVSAIPPRGDVEIALRYDTLAHPRGDGSWELALPMVVAPRYVPGTASGRPTTGAGHAPDTDRAPDASRVTPGGKPNAGGATAVALAFADAVDDVASPTHELAARGSGYAFTDAHSDHDALVRWRGKQPDSGWVEQDDDGGYALAVVAAPPAKARTPGSSGLELALVLDRSALAHGDADATERPLVRELLAGLVPADGITVTGSATLARSAPIDVWRELDRNWAPSPGAFDLTRALRGARAGTAGIVLVTPGLVADDTAALAAARALKTPIHVVGIGPAPNRALLLAIARDTGGTVRFVAPDDDLPATARDVIADVATPPAPLAVSWGALAASDVVPATMPRLGAGQARLVLARVQRAVAANGRARGDVFAIAMIQKEPPAAGATTPRGPLARRWAREKLGELVESARVDATAATQLALRYGLVSPYTSMVAIGDEVIVRGGVKHTVSVPVSVPAGMRWQPLERELHVVTKGELAEKDERKAEERERERDDEADKNVEHGKAKAPKTEPRRQAPPAKKESPAPTPKPMPTTPRPPPPAHRAPAQDPATAGAAAPEAPPPAAAPPAPTATPTATRPSGGDDDSDGVSDSSGEDASDAHAKRKVATLDAESAPMDDEIVGSSYSPRRVARLGLALGAGLEVDDPRLLVALSASYELGQPSNRAIPRFGIEGGLWLVGGAHAQERVLLTAARHFGRLSLSFGLGAQVADFDGVEIGPAVGAILRYELTPHLSVYLRYDGTILYGSGGATENAPTAGAEWGF